MPDDFILRIQVIDEMAKLQEKLLQLDRKQLEDLVEILTDTNNALKVD